MTRYGRRDDRWERIKDLLPGKPDDVGATARDNRRFVEVCCTGTGREYHGAICRSALATGRIRTGASAAGPKPA